MSPSSLLPTPPNSMLPFLLISPHLMTTYMLMTPTGISPTQISLNLKMLCPTESCLPLHISNLTRSLDFHPPTCLFPRIPRLCKWHHHSMFAQARNQRLGSITSLCLTHTLSWPFSIYFWLNLHNIPVILPFLVTPILLSCAKSLQSCLTLCSPIDCSQPGSSVWDSSSKNTGVGCRALLQGILLTQGSNLGLLSLLHCRQILYHWATGEATSITTILIWVTFISCLANHSSLLTYLLPSTVYNLRLYSQLYSWSGLHKT